MEKQKSHELRAEMRNGLVVLELWHVGHAKPCGRYTLTVSPTATYKARVAHGRAWLAKSAGIELEDVKGA